MSAYISRYLFPFLFVLTLSGCGGGSDGAVAISDDPVADTLANLGVDVGSTARKGDDSVPLPDDYNPFGSSRSFEQFDELVLLGFPLAVSSGFDSELTLLELDRLGSSASYDIDVLFAPDPALTPWALSVGADPAALRVAARGDIDRDGLEELLIAYRAPGQSSIKLQVYEDQTQSFAEGQTLNISNDPANSLAIASGDFNGDGYAELVIGLVFDDSVQLIFVDNEIGSLSLSTSSKTLPQAFNGSVIDLIIETGNLDYDPSHELVVLVNEVFQQVGSPESGTTRYFVFDDGKNNFADIANALVQADLGTLNRTAIVADVSLGDVDGDNIDEIVFAGLTNFDPNGLCSYNYLLVVLDDLVRNRAPISAMEHTPNIHGSCSATQGELRFVHVNTPDLDGDGIAEIQANELIFEDFAQFPPWTSLMDRNGQMGTQAALIPDDSLFENNTGFTGRFSRLNSSMVVADLTSDKRQDIILYSQSTNSLEVWGLSEPDPDLGVVSMEWRMLKTIPVEPPASNDVLRPVLLPINVNHDGLAISFDEGEYQLVFTEPVLIAALAGAPCYEGLGQNTDACRTAYGTAESTTVELDNTLTVSAGVSVGFEAEFSALGVKVAGVEAIATVKVHASLITSAAYTYTERVVYTTGPVEDTVVFTSIPYDQYTYTITSNPDPELIGSKIVVSMPRSPVTIQVERGFYNANVEHGGPLIDASVFTHVAGNPLSYPDESTKDNLISTYSSLLPSQWAYDFGPTTVGQGGGDTTLEINVATEAGIGVAVGIEAEFAAQVTASGVIAGFSVGVSSESSLQIRHGKESSYTGTVANLPDIYFAANAYDWGLFTYVMDDHASGQKFEILNYWVE